MAHSLFCSSFVNALISSDHELNRIFISWIASAPNIVESAACFCLSVYQTIHSSSCSISQAIQINSQFELNDSIFNFFICASICAVGFANLVKDVHKALVAKLPCKPLSHKIPIVALISSIGIHKAAAVGQAYFIASANCRILVFDLAVVRLKTSITFHISEVSFPNCEVIFVAISAAVIPAKAAAL